MSTDYDLFHNPELTPVIQNKVARTIQRVSKLCLKVCYRDAPPKGECLKNCVTSYVEAFDVVLDTLRTYDYNR
ncbi:unnamed protein product [Blepharisma stoltei]|uniref:Mitochondrial import inner membrane translocase subunit n=1 Tax=Blepharisma stoltei TaxID=1481888 RepID=A0AAU9KCA6_9CILI|nr:unnamed protein product [Blepharisma stoltei]